MVQQITRRTLIALVSLSLAGGLTLTGCAQNTPAPDGSAASPAAEGGKKHIVIGQTGVIDSLDPIKKAWGLTSFGVSEYVYLQDEKGELYSRFISDIRQDGDLDWTLTVKPGVKFSDGSDVDAKAICTSLNEIQETNKQSNASAGKITFTPEGDKIKAHTERETKVMKSILGEWSNIIFKRDGDKVVFTGPYMVKSLDPKVSLELVPNPSYDENASKRPDITVKAFSDPDAMKLAIQSKSIDMAFTITPAVADQLANDSNVALKTIDAGYQYFGRFNLKNGIATDKAVRQALDAGMNRDDYVKALKGGHPATGLFAHYYSFAGKEDVTADPAKANKILDDAGYVKGADGMRAKDGKPLKIQIVTYPSRPDLGLIMQVMVSQLKQLGIAAETRIVDDIGAEMKSGNYDLILWAQHTAPTGEPAFFLNHFFRSDGSNNTNGYNNPQTDQMLDELGKLAPGPERDAEAVKIQHQIREDLPALYLVDPQWHIAVSQALKNYQPYCGDYYVINAELGLN